jgi:hypothetical protein
MIDIDVKIHDRLSIEFKVGFVVRRKLKRNEFAINTWLFFPNGLDINPTTYGKTLFYRDVKSNLRLITPRFLLREIVGGHAVPLHKLRYAMESMAADPTRSNCREYEYQVKMFAAIFKSAQRDAAAHVVDADDDDRAELLENYIANVRAVAAEFRALRPVINTHTVSPTCMEYFTFADEFIGNATLITAFSLIETLGPQPALTSLVAEETEYKKAHKYLTARAGDTSNNRDLVFRQGVLKKYIESDLFLTAQRKKDGRMAEQLLYSIAAGASMVFATAISFWGQRKFGSVAMPFFFALVVSYMLKDRIKEVLRYYFAHSLGRRYFDNKTRIGIKETEIGWIKEDVDFIAEQKVPQNIAELRGRSSLLEAENRTFDEKILLYRKLAHIDRESMEENNEYRIAGVNDIMRLHFNSFVEKADDPMVAIPLLDDDGNVQVVDGEKIYLINIILQLRYDDQTKYKRYRVLFTRAGITRIEELH